MGESHFFRPYSLTTYHLPLTTCSGAKRRSNPVLSVIANECEAIPLSLPKTDCRATLAMTMPPVIVRRNLGGVSHIQTAPGIEPLNPTGML